MHIIKTNGASPVSTGINNLPDLTAANYHHPQPKVKIMEPYPINSWLAIAQHTCTTIIKRDGASTVDRQE
jgi:hypothetical protein